MPKYGSFGDGPIYTMNPYRRPGFFPRVDQLMWDASIARQTSEKHAELASVTAVPDLTAPIGPRRTEVSPQGETLMDGLTDVAAAAAIGVAGGLLVGLVADKNFRNDFTVGLKRLWNSL